MRSAGHPDGAPPAHRIGPNAVLQLDAALQDSDGQAVRLGVFRRAGLLRHLRTPPTTMVEEAEVARLFAALRHELGPDAACRRAEDAGLRTAQYLLAHRIPKPMRRILPHLPHGIAARLLTGAIQRHGWTFLGSGTLGVDAGRPLGIHIRLAACLEPVGDVAGAFYRATFEALFRALVSPRTTARPRFNTATACDFDLAW
jgi:divinyl protochlorophyllide a 8-vinyl-reductase